LAAILTTASFVLQALQIFRTRDFRGTSLVMDGSSRRACLQFLCEEVG
jgi:uncharacterized protein with PQ loop repeat